MALTTVVAYDVSEDRRRARLAALLQKHGDRVQFSVFVCRLDDAELTGLLDAGRTIIDVRTDLIYVFRQCADCWAAIGSVGQAHPPQPTLYWAVF